MRMRAQQRGFTTVELAFAGVIAAGLTLAGMNLLLKGLDVKAELDGRVRANQAARAAMATLTDGAATPNAGADGFNIAHGVRNRRGAPTVALQNGEVLQMTSNGATVTGERVSPTTVICIGEADPTPACTAAGDAVTLDGPMVSAPLFQDAARTVRNRTVEMEIRVQDPWSAARGIRRIERYGGMSTYNAEGGEGVRNGATDVVNPAGGN